MREWVNFGYMHRYFTEAELSGIELYLFWTGILYWYLHFYLVPCSWIIHSISGETFTSPNPKWSCKHNCTFRNFGIFGNGNAGWLKWSQKKGLVCSKGSCQSTCLLCVHQCSSFVFLILCCYYLYLNCM